MHSPRLKPLAVLELELGFAQFVDRRLGGVGLTARGDEGVRVQGIQLLKHEAAKGELGPGRQGRLGRQRLSEGAGDGGRHQSYPRPDGTLGALVLRPELRQ